MGHRARARAQMGDLEIDPSALCAFREGQSIGRVRRQTSILLADGGDNLITTESSNLSGAWS